MIFFKKYWLWIFLVLIFSAKGIIGLDPDFGWHLTVGKLILEKGVPPVDPFTYSMPDYPVVDHEWLTDAIIARLYPKTGMIGLSVVGALFAAAAVFISTSRVKGPNAYKNITVLLASGVLVHAVGIRPQVLSWFFLSVFLWLLGNWKRLRVTSLIIPFLFLAWVNLHGGFAVGIVLLILWLGIKSYRDKSIKPVYLLTVLTSIGATLINPYGIGIWQEVIKTFFSSSLRWGVLEWLPGITAFVFCLPPTVVLGTYFMYRFKKKFRPEEIMITAVFLVMAASAVFQIPFFVISVIPIIVWGILYLRADVSKIKGAGKRFETALKYLRVIVIILFLLDVAVAFKDAYSLSEDQFYPRDAISFISGNLPDGEIFSEYGWGGYLIWKLPQKKVYIDGRMPHWPNIFEEYADVILGKKDYKPVFDKYNIEMVLWPRAEEGKEIQLLVDLRRDGWGQMYSDEVSVILIKNRQR